MATKKEVFVPHSSVDSSESVTYGDLSKVYLGGVFEAFMEIAKFAMEQARCDDDSPFVICDYGSADGTNSIPIIRTCIDILRRHCKKQKAVQVYYEDVATNDFNVLFKRLHGLTTDVDTFLSDYEDVYIYGSGTNFYSKCFPRNSIDFGYSTTCVHWLSKRPPSTSMLYMLANESERQIWAEAAANDWEKFLLCRAEELKSGGQLIIETVSTNENGIFHSNERDCQPHLYCLFRDSWKDLLDTKMVTMEEFKDTSMNLYFRSKEEWAAPFEKTDSKVMMSGLRLISCKTILFRDAMNASYRAAIVKNNTPPFTAAHYAKTLTDFTRKWSDSALFFGLNANRTAEDRRNIKDSFWNFVENTIACSPEKIHNDLVFGFVHIKKEL